MSVVKQMMAALIRELRSRRGARDLGRLDDRMLRDIGLRRSGLDAAARFGRADAGDAV